MPIRRLFFLSLVLVFSDRAFGCLELAFGPMPALPTVESLRAITPSFLRYLPKPEWSDFEWNYWPKKIVREHRPALLNYLQAFGADPAGAEALLRRRFRHIDPGERYLLSVVSNTNDVLLLLREGGGEDRQFVLEVAFLLLRALAPVAELWTDNGRILAYIGTWVRFDDIGYRERYVALARERHPLAAATEQFHTWFISDKLDEPDPDDEDDLAEPTFSAEP